MRVYSKKEKGLWAVWVNGKVAWSPSFRAALLTAAMKAGVR